MLHDAGFEFSCENARIDEVSILASLVSDGAKPRNVSDQLAEAKARKVSSKFPEAVVIAADQILEFDDQIFQKASDREELARQLSLLAGNSHTLFSAAVIYQDARPIWRHVSKATLTMRSLTSGEISSYVNAYWELIRHSVGGYRVEAEGIRLFSHIQGDHFTILGLPLIQVAAYLRQLEATNS